VLTLASTVELLACLHKADDRLQAMMKDLKKDYYAFIYEPLKLNHKIANHLLLRSDLDPDGRIRRLFWAKKTKAKRRLATGREVRLSNRLRGPFRASWIYTMARDWARREAYYGFEDRRRALVGRRQEVVRVLRALRLSFACAWGHRASEGDLAEAARILASRSSALSARDLRAITGMIVFCRELRTIETAIGHLVEEYRRTFLDRGEVSFEPELRTRPNGLLRLSWGHPETIHTQEGPRLFTQHIPGRPTDLFMRALGLRAPIRREVGAFLKRLLPLQGRYRALVAFLGRHRQRIHELVVRIDRVTASGAWPKALAASPAVPPVPPRAGGHIVPGDLRAAP